MESDDLQETFQCMQIVSSQVETASFFDVSALLSCPVTRAGLPPSGGEKGSLSATYFGIVWGSMDFVSCQGLASFYKIHTNVRPQTYDVARLSGLRAFAPVELLAHKRSELQRLRGRRMSVFGS